MRVFILIVSFLGLLILQFSCGNFETDESLAERSCGGCHLAPTPDMLDKATWEESILPRMGAWLGVESKEILIKDMAGNSSYGRNGAEDLIPVKPMISEAKWEKIKRYYIDNSPQILKAESQPKLFKDLEDLFEIEPISMDMAFQGASNTLIHFDAKSNRIYVGRRNGRLMVYDGGFNKIDSSMFTSSPADLTVKDNGDVEVLLTGEIRPNNEPLGVLEKWQSNGQKKSLVHGLFRPVNFLEYDFNGDGLQDYVICNFGFHVGKLSWYKALPNGDFEEKLLLPLAGAIQVKIEDYDQDGLMDIIALFSQGNESVFGFKNLGKGQFKPDQWIQLPPVYGTTAFEWFDFDNDGNKDIVIANGDNADYSLIEKPYHGVRLFKNEGNFNFKEVKFVPLKGAAGLELADFDLDGKMDLAVIANFAAFKESPQRGFVVLKNLGNFEFEPFLSAKTDSGRYLVFEQGDFDQDGDVDILLGSHLVPLMVEREQLQKWAKGGVDLILLKNRAK
ncbi:MAG: VCBS repeat-containing protein [Cytophagales bacterium]|nr:VCBS repeat-containing protein [Cytophagales bacterium]